MVEVLIAIHQAGPFLWFLYAEGYGPGSRTSPFQTRSCSKLSLFAQTVKHHGASAQKTPRVTGVEGMPTANEKR